VPLPFANYLLAVSNST